MDNVKSRIAAALNAPDSGGTELLNAAEALSALAAVLPDRSSIYVMPELFSKLRSANDASTGFGRVVDYDDFEAFGPRSEDGKLHTLYVRRMP